MDYDYDDEFKPYVSVAERRVQAARELARLQKKGRTMSPVSVQGRKIAATFWGEAWCTNLERYSDYANRLPRGRTYVRNGSVLDLQVGPGTVSALVSGSTIYDVKVSVGPVAAAPWSAICRDCSGAIDSLVELLQGRFSKGVMTRLCEQKTGLFPSSKDILFTCSCPDRASMCKHVAAVLYGIGARLDQQPELLFTLRNVNHQDLIAKAGSGLAKPARQPAGGKVLETDDLAAMFGIEMAPVMPAQPAVSVARTSRRSAAAPGDGAARPEKVKAPSVGRRKLSPLAPAKRPAKVQEPQVEQRAAASREAISARMREYWAARRDAKRKASR